MKLILLCLIVSTLVLIDARYTPTNIKDDDTEETLPIFDIDSSLEETTEPTLTGSNEEEEESPLDIQVDTQSNYGSKQKKAVEEKSQKTENMNCLSSENCLETKVLRLNSQCDESEKDENLCEKQVKDSECRKGSCACKDGFVNMENLMCLPGKRALGEACFLRAQCQDLTPGSECVKGVCACHHAALSEKPGEGCIPELRLGDSCNLNQDCNSATKNSVCSEDKKCVCNKGSKVTSYGACILGKGIDEKCSSSGNECLDENAECKQGICSCKKHYILYQDVCVSEKLLNDACQNSQECTVKNSVCQSGKCVCDSEYFSWEDTFCLQGNVSEGGSCSISEQCKSPSLVNKIVVCAKPYGSDDESLCLVMPVSNDNLKPSEKETSNVKEKNKLKTTEPDIKMSARSSLSKYANSKAIDLESEDELEDTSTEATKTTKVLTTGEKMITKSLSTAITKPIMELTTLRSNLLLTTKLSYNNKKLKNKIASTLEVVTSQATTIPTLSTEAITSSEAPMSTEAPMTTEESILPDGDLGRLYENTEPQYEEYDALESPITWKVVKKPKNHYGLPNSQLSKQNLGNNKNEEVQENDEILKADYLSSSLMASNNNMGKYNTHISNKEITEAPKINSESSTNPSVSEKMDSKMKDQGTPTSDDRHPMLMPNKMTKSKNYHNPSSSSQNTSPNNSPKIDPAISEMDD